MPEPFHRGFGVVIDPGGHRDFLVQPGWPRGTGIVIGWQEDAGSQWFAYAKVPVNRRIELGIDPTRRTPGVSILEATVFQELAALPEAGRGLDGCRGTASAQTEVIESTARRVISAVGRVNEANKHVIAHRQIPGKLERPVAIVRAGIGLGGVPELKPVALALDPQPDGDADAVFIVRFHTVVEGITVANLETASIVVPDVVYFDRSAIQ